MKHLSSLIISAVLLGNFVSVAQAKIVQGNRPSLTTTAVIETRQAVKRVSKRQLELDKRSTWKPRSTPSKVGY